MTFELIREIIYEVTNIKLLFSSSEYFKVPFSLSNFYDAIFTKVSMDKSGGSTRTMLNLVNVKTSQSLTHLKLLGSFDGSKDSYANLERNFKK